MLYEKLVQIKEHDGCSSGASVASESVGTMTDVDLHLREVEPLTPDTEVASFCQVLCIAMFGACVILAIVVLGICNNLTCT